MIESESKKIASNFIWRLLERFGAQLVTLVVSIVLARLLDPSIYGLIALVTVIITILQVFVDSGLGNSLIQKKDSDDTDFSTVFFFNIGACIVLYVMLFLFAPYIAKFYVLPELTSVIRVLGLSLIISGVKNIQQAYVSRNMLFKKFFFSTLGGTICAAIVGITLAIHGYGVWALVAQHLTNLALDTIILWITVKWRPKLLFSWARFKGLFSYGWKFLITGLITQIYTELRTLIIGKKYTPEDLAFYNKGEQFPKFLGGNTTASVDSVLFPTLSNKQDDLEEVKKMMRKSITIASFISWPLMVGLAAVAPSFIELLLGEKWLPIVPYLQIFCISYAFFPIQSANLNAIKAIGRSDIYLKQEIIKKVFGVLIILMTLNFGVFWIAIGTVFNSFFAQIVNSWPNKKLLKYNYFQQIKDILPSVILATTMGATVYCINFLCLNNVLTLLIQVLLGVIIYMSGAKLFKFESFNFLLTFIKNFKNKKQDIDKNR